MENFTSRGFSPDLASSDFHLIRSLQHHWADEQFTTLDEIRDSFENFIKSKPQRFFRDGIHQLLERWATVIENNGRYFE